MGAEEGVCSMSIQMLSHSKASTQVKSQPGFTVRHTLEIYREKGWIKREGEVKDIRYLYLAELIM